MRRVCRGFVCGIHGARWAGKGVRSPAAIPDRLKEAIDVYGQTGCPNVHLDNENNYVPQERRQNILNNLVNMRENMISRSRLDRLNKAMDRCCKTDPQSHEWKEAYVFLKTTEYCLELVEVETDRGLFEKGKPLWINLQECEEQRRPYLCKLPNELLVTPICSMNDYQDHYFEKCQVFDSCWFPVPRTGTQWEEFCKLPFPVLATGNFTHMCSLSTVANKESQFGMLLNPGLEAAKFLSYPEMIRTSQKRSVGTLDEPIEGFHESLQVCFDTSKLQYERVHPQDAAKIMVKRLRSRDSYFVPEVAVMELHMLVFRFENIRSVYLQLNPTARWKRLLGSSQRTAYLQLVQFSNDPKEVEVVAKILQQWSYISEFHMDVDIAGTTVLPTEENVTCLMSEQDGPFYRAIEVRVPKESLRKIVGYDDPL